MQDDPTQIFTPSDPNSGHQNPDQGQIPPEEPGRSLFSWKILVGIIVLGALIPLAAHGWTKVYRSSLEFISPVIQVVELPRGIGLTPVTLQLELSDSHSGIRDITVIAKQKGSKKELYFKQFPRRQHNFEVPIEFDGERSGLEEGSVDIEIRVRDYSLWKNSSLRVLPLSVDFRRPLIRLISSSNEIKPGGSELVFYSVTDEDIAIHGVKVDKNTFNGFPAQGIDKEFRGQSLYVALFALPLKDGSNSAKVFAEDRVGNATSVQVPLKLLDFPAPEVLVHASDDFMRNDVSSLADINFKKLQTFATKAGSSLNYLTPAGSRERLMEKFRLLNVNLRELNNNELISLLNEPRFEKLWTMSFLMPAGSIDSSFGENLNYRYGDEEMGRISQVGYEIDLSRTQNRVAAAGDGIILFSQNLGILGRTLAIDHGLGLVSIYGHLESSDAQKGDSVTRGQVIGMAGRTGLTSKTNLYFQMRIQGIPVDSKDWSSDNWYQSRITKKIDEAKRALGMPVYRLLP